jgi:hypothetical protein
LLDQRLGGRAPENNLVHGAENHTSLMHACPPRIFWLCWQP